MQVYLQIIGYSFIAGSITLLIYRSYFILTGRTFLGEVSEVVYRQTLSDSGVSRARHLKVNYVNAEGQHRFFVPDNSLLVFFYRINDSIKLTENRERVMVSNLLNILTAPLVIFLMGLVALLTGLR